MQTLQKIFYTILNWLFPPSFSREDFVNVPAPEPAMFPFIRSCVSYRAPVVRRAVRHLKTYHDTRLAELFATHMHEQLLEEFAERRLFENLDQILVIPLPISTRRHRERGYNQTELIARALVEKDNLYRLATNALIKSRETKKQAVIQNKKQRAENVKYSFSARNSHLIKSNVCLLVDDVTTTGATLADARRALLDAGAREVIAITFAH